MSDQIFYGIAHGGPLHGQIINSEAPEFRAVETHPAPRYTPNVMGRAVNGDIRCVTYRFNVHGQWVCDSSQPAGAGGER